MRINGLIFLPPHAMIICERVFMWPGYLRLTFPKGSTMRCNSFASGIFIIKNGGRQMGDQYPVVKVAAVQACPVFLNREASTEKACRYILEAGKNGAKIIVFPEGFIPSHPLWYIFHPGTGETAVRMSIELFKNSVEVPGSETEMIGRAAKEAGAYVMMGCCVVLR
jgi:hypothetical protein